MSLSYPTYSPSGTSASAWNQLYFNTYISTQTATITNCSFYNSAVNVIGPGAYTRSYEVSPAEMIQMLDALGHKVLQKKNHAIVRGMPVWDKPKNGDFVNDGDVPIHYGYALPEAEGAYLMPDGSTLKVDSYGNYQILDQDAKVTYKANRIREFSRYINASDLLEAFIGEVGRVDGVNQSEILRLPIEAFINWLILQAAKQDGDPLEGLPSVEMALPAPIPKKPRCLSCGRFMSKMWAAARIPFCSDKHQWQYRKRLANGVPREADSRGMALLSGGASP